MSGGWILAATGHVAATELRDYAVIGDMRTAALVSRGGSIDWLCFPRFDSPAVFCRLLDEQRGGFFEIRPHEQHRAERAYLEDTNVLVTTFTTRSGRARLTDFLPTQNGPTIARLVDGISGTVDLGVRLRTTFDFARARARVDACPGGLSITGGGTRLLFGCSRPTVVEGTGIVKAEMTVKAGQRTAVSYGASCLDAEAATRALEETVHFWKAWASRCTYDGDHRELVVRSALTLKLLTYAATGALVAAPTTSLPEAIGGVRNWDYRFTWIRDSALVLDALMRLGYHDDAMAFWRWLEARCIGCCEDLQILYAVDGRPPPRETALPHLDGYRGSRPVRVGNAAAAQRQLDVYGHVLDAAHVCMVGMDVAHPDLEPLLAYLAERAAATWREPDQGIWEMRSNARHFLPSKLSCWVALDRAIRLGLRGWLHGDIHRWRRVRAQIRRAILNYGYDKESGAFTQALGESALDASALLLPRAGLLPPDDPRILSTIDRICERLTANGLVYRYLNDDGLPGAEATFAICTFWLVEALAGAGRFDRAREVFERVTSFANDVGLLGEEIDPTSGALLGNFPQGFSHLGLVRAALALQGPAGGPA